MGVGRGQQRWTELSTQMGAQQRHRPLAPDLAVLVGLLGGQDAVRGCQGGESGAEGGEGKDRVIAVGLRLLNDSSHQHAMQCMHASNAPPGGQSRGVEGIVQLLILVLAVLRQRLPRCDRRLALGAQLQKVGGDEGEAAAPATAIVCE